MNTTDDRGAVDDSHLNTTDDRGAVDASHLEELQILTTVCAMLSLIAASATCTIYALQSPHDRKHMYWHLVLCNAIADAFAAVGDLLLWGASDRITCLLSSMGIQFFDLASVAWVGIIAHFLFRVIVIQRPLSGQSLAQLKVGYHCFVWGLCLVFMLLPLSGGFSDGYPVVYGHDGGWCWLAVDGAPVSWTQQTAPAYWVYVLFYGPLLTFQAGVLYAVVRCRMALYPSIMHIGVAKPIAVTIRWRVERFLRWMRDVCSRGQATDKATHQHADAVDDAPPPPVQPTQLHAAAAASSVSKNLLAKRVLYRLLAGYPAILFLTWAVGTFRRFWNTIADGEDGLTDGWSHAQLFFNSLSGFFNFLFLVYSRPMSPGGRTEVRACSRSSARETSRGSSAASRPRSGDRDYTSKERSTTRRPLLPLLEDAADCAATSTAVQVSPDSVSFV